MPVNGAGLFAGWLFAVGIRWWYVGCFSGEVGLDDGFEDDDDDDDDDDAVDDDFEDL